jgi:hypothetical protein
LVARASGFVKLLVCGLLFDLLFFFLIIIMIACGFGGIRSKCLIDLMILVWRRMWSGLGTNRDLNYPQVRQQLNHRYAPRAIHR